MIQGNSVFKNVYFGVTDQSFLTFDISKD